MELYDRGSAKWRGLLLYRRPALQRRQSGFQHGHTRLSIRKWLLRLNLWGAVVVLTRQRPTLVMFDSNFLHMLLDWDYQRILFPDGWTWVAQRVLQSSDSRLPRFNSIHLGPPHFGHAGKNGVKFLRFLIDGHFALSIITLTLPQLTFQFSGGLKSMILVNLLQILERVRILRFWLFLLVIHRQERDIIDTSFLGSLQDEIVLIVSKIVSVVMNIIFTHKHLIFKSLLTGYWLLARRSCEMGCDIPWYGLLACHILRSVKHFQLEGLLLLVLIVHLLRFSPHLTELLRHIRFWRCWRQPAFFSDLHLIIAANLVHWTQILGRRSNLIPCEFSLLRVVLFTHVKVIHSFQRRRTFVTICNLSHFI